MLFRSFVGLGMDADVWQPTVFTHNRDRLLEGDIAREFLARCGRIRSAAALGGFQLPTSGRG